MNQEERLHNLLLKKDVDVLPWYADISYWHFAKTEQNQMEDKYRGLEGLVKLHKDLNLGFYLSGFKPLKARYTGGKYSGISHDGSGYDDMIHVFSHVLGVSAQKDSEAPEGHCPTSKDTNMSIGTPYGELREKWEYSQQTFSWAPMEYFIKSEKDFEPFLYWIEKTEYCEDYESIAQIAGQVKGIGFTLGLLLRSPFQQLVTTFAGLEKTIEFSMDAKTRFEGLLDRMAFMAEKPNEIVINSPATLLMICENLSSQMVGTKYFAEYLSEYESKWYKRIKERGKYSMIHFDGALKGLLHEVGSTNPTIIEAMTPYPYGDLRVDEYGKYVESDSVMWGGIPGPMFTEAVSERDFERYVVKAIEVMAMEKRYVLGIGDQIPPDGLIKRIEVVSNLVEKYGKY